MLRSLVLHRIDAFERKAGVSLDYLRFIARTSVPLLRRLAKVVPFATRYRHTPTAAHYVAALHATVDQDCGSCAQLVVNDALAAGIDAGFLETVLHFDGSRFEESLKDVSEFARAVLRGGDVADARERVRKRYGDKGLVELTYAIAGAQVFPTVKRALGYATPCNVAAISFGTTRIPDPVPKSDPAREDEPADHSIP